MRLSISLFLSLFILLLSTSCNKEDPEPVKKFGEGLRLKTIIHGDALDFRLRSNILTTALRAFILSTEMK